MLQARELVPVPSARQVSQNTHSRRTQLTCSVLIPVSIVAITALCLGYDAGVMSGAIGPITQSFDLSEIEVGIVVGCINLIAAPGALVGGKLADWKGRVTGVAGTAVVLFIGPLLVATAGGFLQMLLGRLVTGVGVGLSMVLAPLYAAEVSPPGIRAGIVALTEVLINAGVVLGYLSAMLIEVPGIYSSDVGWRIVTGIAALPALLTLVAVPWLPESPRWLVQVQKRDEAEKVIARLVPDPSLMEDCIRSIDEAIAAEVNQTEVGWIAILCPSRLVCRMLLAGLGVAFFQQISGSEAIVYYTPTILENFGITTDSGQNLGAILVGLAKFFGACLGALFLDCAGRRAGVLVSCLGVATCLVTLAAVQGQAESSALGLSALCLFMVFFELGLAPAAFVLGTESYPAPIRAKALGLGMFITRFLSGLVAVAFPAVVQTFSLSSCLWAFAIFACFGVLWAIYCVPETKGLSLEEAARLFESPIHLFRLRDASVECANLEAVGKYLNSKSTPLQNPEDDFPHQLAGA